MSLYVEVHCDKRLAWPDGRQRLDARCWTDRNDNPQSHCVTGAKLEAKRQGWKLEPRNRAICPGCQDG